MLKQINPNKNPLQKIKKGNINDVNNYINNVSKYNFYKNILIYYIERWILYSNILPKN